MSDKKLTVIEEIIAERGRAVFEFGRTPAKNDRLVDRELSRAGLAYAAAAAAGRGAYTHTLPDSWPFPASAWCPETPRRNMIKAISFLIAEIERLDRAGEE